MMKLNSRYLSRGLWIACLNLLFAVVPAIAAEQPLPRQLLGAHTTELDALDDTIVAEGIPAGIVHIDPNLPELLWVNLQAGEMYRLKQVRPGWFSHAQPIAISLGKKGYFKRMEGDLRTPIGVYHVTSYLDDDQLDSKYGDGAFPVNYPSAFDRLENRTGSGIWLHGLPKGVSSRPLFDSDGCVVVDNKTLGFLKPLIQPKETLVVMSEDLTWLEQRPEEYDALMQTIETWRQDWQSLDAERYLRHYHENFTDFNRELREWQRYKRRVNGNKTWINVKLEQLSAVVHPERPDLVSVRYHQVYKSSNYNWRGWKQMLWQKQEGKWQVIYEGN